MLTNLTVRNFKRFDEVEIELGSPVVFIGPNNSGKTSAMQSLALWDVGVNRWSERWPGQNTPGKRPGVTINRRDLIAVPVPNANLLWRDLHVRNVVRADGRQQTHNVRIDVMVEAISEGKQWKCGLEFDYANPESFYCRPMRIGTGRDPQRMPVPEEAVAVRVVFLPPMSGLAATETRLDHGAVNVRIGEGRTAEVLRNLCYRIHEERPERWLELTTHVRDLFGVELDQPMYIVERGEITMTYRERGTTLDLSSSGRGLQQTLLILSYLYANPGTVLLLDEPDAHLEILRQKEIYQLITSVASDNGSQIIAASHSEVLLSEAGGKDMVVAFVGSPHRMDSRSSQVLKALRDIRFDDYYQAEQTGWVLFLEGSTDLAILRAFARRLNHSDAMRALARPYVHYVGNQPAAARNRYYRLKEALPNLKAAALFDRMDPTLTGDADVRFLTWRRREIENYLCTQDTLEAYALAMIDREFVDRPLFAESERQRRLNAMREAITEVRDAMATLGLGSPWSEDTKVSDDFLTPLFQLYFRKLGIPNLTNKKDFYELADCVPESELDPEIGEKLDAIAQVAQEATPAS